MQNQQTPSTGQSKGYEVKNFTRKVKRYVQTLDLRDDPKLIEEYRGRHGQQNVWPEILEGIRAVGILEMEIYILGTRLVMIVEMPAELDWDTVMSRLATMPRQAEWEDYMSVFQKAEPGATSDEKWKMMEQMFQLTSLSQTKPEEK